MNDVFLGIIAASVLVMAVIQMGAVVMAARAARKVGALADKLDQDVRPLIAHLQAAASDVARSTAMAAAQVERADRLLTDATHRVDRILGTAQDAVAGASRASGAWVAGLKAAITAFLELRDPPRRRRTPEEEDEGLFIG